MIKRLQNDFAPAGNTAAFNELFTVSASFLAGALAALFYMQRFGTDICGRAFPFAVFACMAIILETIVLGCSLIGEAVVPVCAMLLGALVCICSNEIRLYEVTYAKTAVAFAILTPVFFVIATEGMGYSCFLSASVCARPVSPGREKYILYACIAFVISTGVFHAMCI